MIRRLVLAFLALVVATTAQAQAWRPGFAPGFRPGFQFIARAGLPAAVPLPAVTGGYQIVYGLSRLVSAYAGPSLRVQCGASATQVDVGFDGLGYADLPTAQAACSGAELRVVTWYEQTGTGRHATGSATAPALLPILTTQRAAYGAAFPARPIILQQGLPYGYPSQQVAGLAIPTSLSVDRANVGWLDAVAPNVSVQNNTIAGLGAATGTNRLNLFTQASNPGLCSHQYTAAGGATPAILQTSMAMAPRQNLGVLGLVSRSTGQTTISDGARQTFAAQESLTLTGGFLGSTNGGAAGYYFRGDRFAFAVFSGTATDAEITAAQQTLSGIIGAAPRNVRLVVLGSSTPEGQGASNAVAGRYATQSYVRQLAGLLSGEIDVYNTAVSGRQAEGYVTTGRVAAEVTPLFATGRTNVALLDVGSNDIALGIAPATVYGNLKTVVGQLKAAGFRVVIATIGPRSDVTGTNETNRQTLNASIRGGQADMGWDGMVDVAAISELDNPGALNDNYVQEPNLGPYIHKTVKGMALIAAKALPVVQAQIPAGAF